MTRWEALTSICEYLQVELLGGGRSPERDIAWELVVEVASFHLVTPALAGCLRRQPDIPPDIRDYFETIAAYNRARNESMLATLARVAGLLNAIDIEPVLLKGSSLLVEGVYSDLASRLLGDADILIPADRAADADTALRAAGFHTLSADVIPPPLHHHLPRLHDPESGTSIELHTDVVTKSGESVISTVWFCERPRPTLFRNQRVLLPDPTRNAGHIIFHSEIADERYALNKIQLRHMLDLALLRSRHESSIDWGELDRRFSAGGFGEVLATYLGFAESLLGQPAPKLSHSPREGALDELRDQESRDSFRRQIEHLKTRCDQFQTKLSQTIAGRHEAERYALELQEHSRGLEADRNGWKGHAQALEIDRDEWQSHAQALEIDRDKWQRRAQTLQERLEVLQNTLIHAEQKHEVMLRSTSWRLTAPLRALIAIVKRTPRT